MTIETLSQIFPLTAHNRPKDGITLQA